MLAHAAYTPVREIDESNELIAGREMFRLACSRCHTTVGVNGVLQKLGDLFGWQQWDAVAISTYLRGMHNARPFMPPLPGTDEERSALVHYLLSLRESPVPLHGAQTAGAASRYD